MIVFLNSKPCPALLTSSLKCDASLRRRERHEICNTCSCSSPYQTIGQLSRKVCQRSYIRPSLSPLRTFTWPLHASRTFCGHLRAASVGPVQPTLPRCVRRRSRTAARYMFYADLAILHRAGIDASRFTFSILHLLAKIQCTLLGARYGNISFLIWTLEVQIWFVGTGNVCACVCAERIFAAD